MMYKDINNPNPSTRTRVLRRIWKVTVYEEEPNSKKTGKAKKNVKTREETVIAWNQVDANRKAPGKLAVPAEPIGFVTWPRDGESHVYMIDNPTDGPIEDEPVQPSVGGVDDEEDWDF
jgi:hypothetical protein